MLHSDTLIERTVQGWLDSSGIAYRTQAPISRFFADILLCDFPVVIECDGDYWHALPGVPERDRTRNIIMRRLGYHVVRLAESAIHKDPDGCQRRIQRAVAMCS